MNFTREATTAAPRDVEGPTPDWWPPAEPVAHDVHAADLRMTRASTAAPRDSPVAIAAASRNAIQEAKNRKAAARARMAQRRNAPVRNQGGEDDDAAPRDEARDLWERFGQVAPPPPRTLVVVKRPQPMRRSDGSKSVALHPSEAASYCDSYNAGGGELYLRLSDGGPDESSGWFFQVVADTGIEAGSVGLNWNAREDTGFGLGAEVTVRPWQPSPDQHLVTLHLTCAPSPTTPLAAGEKYRIEERQLCAFLTRYYTGAVVKVGERILVYYAATKSRPKMTIILTVKGMKSVGERSPSFGQNVATTSVKIKKAAGAGKNFILQTNTITLRTWEDCFVFAVGLALFIIALPIIILWAAVERIRDCFGGDAGHAAAAAGGDAAPANVAAAGGDAAAAAQSQTESEVSTWGPICIGVVIGIVLFAGLSAVLGAVSWALQVGWRFVSSVSVLGPVFAFARFLSDAVVGSVPYRLLRCVFRAYVNFDLWSAVIYGVQKEKEYTPMEIPENAGPLGTLMLLSVEWGFNALGIYLEYRFVAKALAVCKYLADPHAHVEGGIPAGP